MGDFKSKLPDLKELGSMTGKLFKDIKSSVSEIINDYQDKRREEEADENTATANKPEAKDKPTAKDTDKPAVKDADKPVTKEADKPTAKKADKATAPSDDKTS